MHEWIIKDIMDAIKEYYFASLASGVILFVWLLIIRKHITHKFNHIQKNNVNHCNGIYLLAWLTFSIYISMLVCIVLLSRESGTRDDYNLQILRVLSGNPWQRTYAVENILLFIPFGFIFPHMFKRYLTLRTCVLYGMLISVGIEVVQRITKRGYAELDDVFNNVLGVVIGYAMTAIIKLAWFKWTMVRK